MNIRKANKEDLAEILDIYEYARNQMRADGNPKQWGTTEPPVDTVKDDIEKGYCHVAEEGGRIGGVFALIFEEEEAYNHLYEGDWLNNEPYAVIHRVAGNGTIKNVLQKMLEYSEALSDNVRLDTHRDNKRMQHLLEKHGYIRCGEFMHTDNMPRIGYHKAIGR